MGGVLMAFQLKQNRKESENKTIRFPLPLIQEIESVIANQDVTFSSFVLQACEYALKIWIQIQMKMIKIIDKNYFTN